MQSCSGVIMVTDKRLIPVVGNFVLLSGRGSYKESQQDEAGASLAEERNAFIIIRTQCDDNAVYCRG